MKKIDDPLYLETSKNELIKLLEFVCKNKGKKVFPSQIKNELFPNLTIEEIYTLIYSIKYRRIQPISLTISNGDPRSSHIQYRDGLEEYVKNLKKMTKKVKLHRIVEFLSTNYSKEKPSFDSEEIAKAFIPELSINEVNSLCEIIIAKGDVIDGTTDQAYSQNMMIIVVTPRTRSAYQTEKYLQEDELIDNPIQQNIYHVNNLSVVGRDNIGKIQQEVKSESPKKTNGKPKWLKYFLWILGALALIFGIIEAIINIF